ncbi:UNVERIFIED_CONTAM: hypothetical protein K2H54_059175 [Gekko kuhli]
MGGFRIVPGHSSPFLLFFGATRDLGVSHQTSCRDVWSRGRHLGPPAIGKCRGVSVVAPKMEKQVGKGEDSNKKMAFREEIDDQEELDENTEIGELTIDQFRRILMEGIQRGIEEAFQNLRENKQSMYISEDNEEKSVQNRQEVTEEEPYRQEKLDLAKQILVKPKLENHNEQRSNKDDTRRYYSKFRQTKRDVARSSFKKKERKGINQKKLKRAVNVKFETPRRRSLNLWLMGGKKRREKSLRDTEWQAIKDSNIVKVFKEIRHLEMIVKKRKLQTYRKKIKIVDWE